MLTEQRKLTPEQQQRVADHYHLTHRIASMYHRNFPGIDRDDIHGAAVDGLMRAGFEPVRDGNEFTQLAWTCIERRILDMLRRYAIRSRRFVSVPSVPFEPTRDEFDDEGHRAGLHRLGQSLRRLPKNRRDIVVRHFLKDMTVDQVAVRMGVTREAASDVISSDLQKMRKRNERSVAKVKRPAATYQGSCVNPGANGEQMSFA